VRDWLEARGSAKMITRGGDPYLWRAYLLALGGGRERGPSRIGKFKTFYHTFYQDDPDPFHDHPWDWGRIIVRGTYREFRRDYQGNVWSAVCRPGHVVWRRPAECLHRVVLLTPTVSTIFWHWKRRRTWGFLHDDGWRPTPDEGQDGRPLRGVILPRKIGAPPTEVIHE